MRGFSGLATGRLLLFLLGTGSLAPGVRAQDIEVAGKLGVNFADLSSEQFRFGSAEGRVRLLGGAAVTVGGERTAIQVEALFSQRGFEVLGKGGTATTGVSYLDVPILVKMRFRPGRKVRPRLLAGGFISFEVTCSVTGSVENLPENGDCDEFFPARGKTDAGLAVGAAVDVGLTGRTFLTLETRYHVGLLNLNWEDADQRVRSRTVALLAGAGVLLGH